MLQSEEEAILIGEKEDFCGKVQIFFALYKTEVMVEKRKKEWNKY